jgi:hypothetical protein
MISKQYGPNPTVLSIIHNTIRIMYEYVLCIVIPWSYRALSETAAASVAFFGNPMILISMDTGSFTHIILRQSTSHMAAVES